MDKHFQDFPYRCLFSLTPLVDFWAQLETGSDLYGARVAETIRSGLADAPELLQPIEDFSVLETHQDLIRTIMSAVIPRAFWGTAISGAASQVAVPLKAQFDNAVDQAAKVMAQTGKLSKEDIQRAADKIKDSYELFQQEKDQEWDAFLKEMGNQIQKAKKVDQEVFKQSVEQAKKKMQEHLASVQGFGEEQKQVIAAYTDDMSSKATGMWQRLKSNLEEGGEKIHRAIEAAAAELKK